MILFTDPRCTGYELPGHPEAPFRVKDSVAFLEETHPSWEWGSFKPATKTALLRAHSEKHLRRLQEARHFDADTAYHEGIYELAKLSCGAAIAAMNASLEGNSGFSLMRPPGHHAEREQAMGFCYLNHVAVCALEARARGLERVAVWDFDAHHGNGTEAILHDVEGTLYVSVHQHPCYPGTGLISRGNCRNYPIPPMGSPRAHMEALDASWQTVLDFQPELVLVSAGFDAYEHDPITQMTLRMKDFEVLGGWLAASKLPVAAILEGGYSEDLPQLISAFLEGWKS